MSINEKNVNTLNKKQKCTHKKIKSPKNKKYSYCLNCGGIIMKENSSYFYILKPFSMEKQLNEDPIQLFHIMQKRSPITKEEKPIQSNYLKKKKINNIRFTKIKYKTKIFRFNLL